MILFLLLSCSVSVAGTQPTPAERERQAAVVLEQARQARTKGNPTAALRLVDEALEILPTSRDAALLKIELASAAGDIPVAFTAYDAYSKAVGKAEAMLLVPIARAELRKLGEDDLSEIRVGALATLAAHGDKSARERLDKSAASQDGGSEAADGALARLGSDRAAARLAERIRSGGLASRLSALDTAKELTSTPPAVQSAVTAALDDKDSAIRAAAAQTAGALKLKSALPGLRRLVASSGPYFVRLSAAASLQRLGDPGGADVLKAALEGDIPEAKAFAARAFSATEAETWRAVMESQLETTTGIDALNAAELLLPLRSEAALQVVERSTADPNPSIRARAARLMAQQPSAPPAVLRRLLADEAPLVRLHTAQGLVQNARPSRLAR